MPQFFFCIISRSALLKWAGAAADESDAWRQYKISAGLPEAYPVEQLMAGRGGLRICQWEL